MSAADAIADIYPLSPMQQGMLFHALLAADSGVYVQQLGCRIAEPIDRGAFRAAWQGAIARHAVLRTAFLWEEADRPLQLVRTAAELPITEDDWREHPPAVQQPMLDRLIEEDRRRGFDLARAPLIRLRLIRIGVAESRLIWTYHHLLLDGWSMATLLGEVLAAYRAARDGEVLRLPPPVPFKTHIAWLGARDGSADETFWRRELAGIDAPTRLMLPAPIPPGNADEIEIALDPATSEALANFARRSGLTLATLAMGAWAILLAHYSGKRDLLFGTVASGREADAVASAAVGLYVNSFPVRLEVPRDAPLLAWLRRLQAHQPALAAHGHAALADIQGWSAIPPPESLFETLFVFENYPVEEGIERFRTELGIDELRFFERTNYSLTMLVLPGATLRVRALFDGARFGRDDLAVLLERYARLLRRLPHAEGKDLGALSWLGEEDREALARWNRTGHPCVPLDGVHRLVERAAREWPEAIAVEQDGAGFSYALLDRRAGTIAARLAQEGALPGDPIGLHLARGFDALAAMLGILKAGCAYVPLDPAHPPDRLRAMAERAQIAILIGDRSAPLVILPPGAKWLVLGGEGDAQLSLPAGGESLAYILHTSGSTGIPKAVAMPHGPLLNLLAWQVRRSSAGPGTRTLQFAALGFDVSFQEIFATWATGGTLVLAPERARRDPEALWSFLGGAGIERAFLPFAMLRALAEVGVGATRPPQALREIVTAGEQLQTTDAIRALFARLDCTLDNQYGPTETHVVTAHRLGGASRDWPVLPPIGRPIDNVQTHILDPEGEPVPPGVIGELHVGGAALAAGYWRQPAATAERFVTTAAGERWYRTGDLARHERDGTIAFFGRADDQLKIRGHRVEPGEIEAALVADPAISEAAVIAEQGSGGQARLVAHVVAVGDPPGEAALRAMLAERLPEPMIPARFVFLHRLPRTTSGKIDRRALARGTRPPPETATGEAGDIGELLVSQVWAAVLGRAPGRDEDFFALGGHSLLATQLVARLREAFAIALPIQALFDHPTVAGLTRHIAETRVGAPPSPLEPRPADAPLPLSSAQERMWLFAELAPDRADANLGMIARIEGPLDRPALARAFAELAGRHVVLRTRFVLAAGVPQAELVDAAPIALPIEWIEDDDAIRARAEAETRHPFDLAREPPLRAVLIARAAEDHSLVVAAHHSAFDGWALGLLGAELGMLYTAFAKGDPPPPRHNVLDYPDYAHWQREYVRAGRHEADLAWWGERLAGAAPMLALPFDRPAPAGAAPDGRGLRFEIDAKRAAALRSLGVAAGATPFMVLLSGFYALLHRYTGAESITVGVPFANRIPAATETMLGCFINPLPLLAVVAGDMPFLDLVERVRALTLDAHDRQSVPLDLILRAAAPERVAGRLPLFQTMFAFQNFPFAAPALPGVALTIEPVAVHGSAFDLALTMWEEGGGFAAVIEYDAGRFEPATIARLADHFRALLGDATLDPERTIAELRLLRDDEQARLLSPPPPDARPESAHRRFAEQARRTPEASAVIEGERSIGYAELDRLSDRIAARLRARGVGGEAIVGLGGERSIRSIARMLGILKAGAAFLPLDPELPRERLAFMLADTAAGFVLGDPAWHERLAGLPVELIDEDGETAGMALPPVDPAQAAYILYTSGSTGRPKGVVVEHRALASYVAAALDAYGIVAGDRVLQFASLAFDTCIEEIFPALAVGATLVTRANAAPEAIDDFVARAAAERISVMSLPTAYWHAWAAAAHRGGALPPPCLRLVIVGGERLAFDRVVAWRGAVGERVRLLNTYGPTEATVVATCCDIAAEWPLIERIGEVPIGRPIANAAAYVLDDHGRAVPPGVEGELHLGGAGLARGYLNRPDENAKRFVGRRYRTGDRVRLCADGNLLFVGRRDAQVKRRGYRIEPAEIESALGRHPAVAEAAVLIEEDRLIAFVVPRGLDPARLRSDLRRSLPTYMLPDVIVQVAALPRGTSGKLDRTALARAGAPSGPPDAQPATAIERALTALWAELLGTPPAGIDADFFASGGHSLLAIELIARLREDFGATITAQALFEVPTIRALARAIEAGIGPAGPAPDPERDVRAYPPLRPDSPAAGQAMRRLFLTGGTGFVGAFLLAELLGCRDTHVECLVRGHSAAAGYGRLRATLEQYQLWRDDMAPRITAVPGDLTRLRFGLDPAAFDALAARIDALFHLAACASAASSYAALAPVNAGGTQEVIRLACRIRAKPLHQVSSLSVLAAPGRSPAQIVTETERLDPALVPADGYGRSKWVAERLVRRAGAAGLPITIYRPGRIVGHGTTGIGHPGDPLRALVRLCLSVNAVPDIDFGVDIVPVDYVAAAIAHLARNGSAPLRCFHLAHPAPVRWRDLLRALPACERLDFSTWRAKVEAAAGDAAEAARLAILLGRAPPVAAGGGVACDQTRAGLAGSGISCPPIDARLIGIYLARETDGS